MNYLIIALAAFAASWLTFFSGFGLGTLLMPVFAIFFPVNLAIGMTAVVHLLNNLFKGVLVGRHCDRNVLLQFGLPAVLTAFAGAWCLSYFAHQPPLAIYHAAGIEAHVTILKWIIAAVMIFFAVLETLPVYQTLAFDPKYFPLGGALSGFFGGLSGHQGALRSAFLIRAGLSKESFIGTGVMIAVMVDLARLTVYSAKFAPALSATYLPYLAAAVLPAFLGAWLGNRFLTKATLPLIQRIVSGMLLFLALLLGAGLL